MSEEQLAAQIDDVTVFYRMAPEHKMKIIDAYKKRGHIVAMTGDGVNDAPALKLADIGVAMGRTGTDVSKEASEMILVDDNFATIVAAIEEGKSIYNNIKNFLRFQLTTSIATLSMVASSTLFGLPLPLTPIQILWINIIMDGPPAQSLGVEPLDRDVMKKPPRDPRKPVFTPIMILSIIVSAFLMVIGTLTVFYAFLEEGKETRAVTMCFTTFVFFQIINAFNCRSEDKSIFKIGLSNNKFFSLAVGGSLLLQLAAIYVPILQGLFDTESLAMNDLFVCLLTASTILVLDEARKYWMARGRLNATTINDPFGLFGGNGGKVSLG
jgi:Ca2+-transporting ATPase